MLTARSPHMSVEEIDSGRRPVPTIRTSATRALLETWCVHELQWVVFQPQAPLVWDQVVGHMRGYLGNLWVSGALQGATASEAFFVMCDQSTMTQEDILMGHVVCLVGLAPVTPGEFTLYRIHIHQKSW